MNRFIAIAAGRPATLRIGPQLVGWVLVLAWWLALGWPLRRGLRSALGGGRRAAAPRAPEPPIRPRRPKASRHRGHAAAYPYPSAA